VIEAAMTLTSDKGIRLDMNSLGKAIECARDMPKLKSDDRISFRAISLDKWDEEWRKGN